jgi:enamine deaminase RidA (YjgF/YER057c/UK114 family)
MTVPAIIPAHFPYFPYEGFTFSLGRQDGEHAWLSGHSGAVWNDDAQKMAIGGGMGQQSVTMYEKIAAILSAADLAFDDVVHIVENVTAAGLDSYAEAEEVRRRVFGAHEPALSTVIVDRLVRRAALIEVQVTARRGGGRTITAGPSGRWHRSTLTEAGGVVHLPTLLPIGEDGEIVAAGDFAGQYRYCLERAGSLLGRAGLSLASVVRTVDYSTPATRDAYRATHRIRRELLGPVYPAAAGILMSRLQRPGALVALDVTASRVAVELVNPGWPRYGTLSYSPGVKTGRLLFMSGFGALDLDTQEALYPGDLAAQAEHTYGSILALLDFAGGAAEDLIETIEFVTPAGLPDYRVVAAVRERLLRPPWPASVGAVCGGLLRPEFMLEVIPTGWLAS